MIDKDYRDKISTEEITIKKERSFAGLLILIIGAYLVAGHLHLIEHLNWATWPALLMFFGGAFLLFAYLAGESDLLFPSILILGIGCHLYFSGHVHWWPKNTTFYPLLIGVGFLIRYYKVKKSGAFIGCTLIVMALYPYFSKSLNENLHRILGPIYMYWPVLLIALGGFLLFKKK